MIKDNSEAIVFLYSELAEYTLASLLSLSKRAENVHVVRWPINDEAPFKFREIPGVTFYERNDYQTNELIALLESLNPKLIITSGWMDKGYVACCKHFHKRCNTVLILDNHWRGGLVQQVKTTIAKQYFKCVFSHIWIPGEPQMSFAKKLGFNSETIKKGFYSADLELFKPISKSEIPHNFVYIGRYLDFKGIRELWEAFIQFKAETKSNWKLHCMGTGDLWDEKIEHPDIIHHGFVQPKEMKDIIEDCGVFVLPSHKEPWGVVVHEMAASGLILLCSDKIGAATTFLREGENGYTFKSKDANSLKQAMHKIAVKSQSELVQMRRKSISLSKEISPEKWAQTVVELL